MIACSAAKTLETNYPPLTQKDEFHFFGAKKSPVATLAPDCCFVVFLYSLSLISALATFFTFATAIPERA
ncbi:MAG: hypothetical protein RL156_324 [Bacteroidota bacterium]